MSDPLQERVARVLAEHTFGARPTTVNYLAAAVLADLRAAGKRRTSVTPREARLAEAIELLREMADAYDEATGDYGKEYAAEELSAARAFIEAHGEGA